MVKDSFIVAHVDGQILIQVGKLVVVNSIRNNYETIYFKNLVCIT
jgi:hypothetical protein